MLSEPPRSPARLRSSSSEIVVCAATQQGVLSRYNDDTFVIADLETDTADREAASPLASAAGRDGVLMLVCDGIGGPAGEVAGWIGSEAILAALHRRDPSADRRDTDAAIQLLRALEVANREILVEARSAGVERQMGAHLHGLLDPGHPCLLGPARRFSGVLASRRRSVPGHLGPDAGRGARRRARDVGLPHTCPRLRSSLDSWPRRDRHCGRARLGGGDQAGRHYACSARTACTIWFPLTRSEPRSSLRRIPAPPARISCASRSSAAAPRT